METAPNIPTRNNGGNDLERQLDEDILACQNEDGASGVIDDPDVMAWRKSNNVQGVNKLKRHPS